MKKIILSAFLLIGLTLHAQDRQVAITVYNHDLAVVKEVRNLELQHGIFDLRYQNVAAKIDPTSVHFKSLSDPDKVQILEQNYEYDLVSLEKIANKYVDNAVTVFLKDANKISGTLLSHEFDNLLLETEAGIIKSLAKSNIINIDFPKLPEGLITRPTLVWKIQNEKPGQQKTEVSYMTSGMNWHAEYVAVAKNNDQRLELNAWVSIENESGAVYPEAKLKLIAGDVHQVEQPRFMMERERLPYAALAKAEPQFEEKEFFEYHLYTLNRPATLQNNQIKQISLFPTTETEVKKIFTFEPDIFGSKVKIFLTSVSVVGNKEICLI